MFAGVEGQGAADAACETAVSMELSRLMGEDCTGGAADIFKCLDQVVTPLVYNIMKEAGMPSKVRKAYEGFQPQFMVRNTIAGGLGEAYGRPTSIPHGGPVVDDDHLIVDASMDHPDEIDCGTT